MDSNGLEPLSCGLVYGLSEHHLDHIAPLCCLLDIPLCVTEPLIKDLASTFYPSLQINYSSQERIAHHLQDFEQVITTLPKDLFDAIFFLCEGKKKRKTQSIWCPHGNSDKGKSSFLSRHFNLLSRKLPNTDRGNLF